MPVIRTLLVDDDQLTISAFLRHFRRDGYEVVSVSSGRAALERLQEDNRFDVIVSDILMPGLSGIDLLREVRKRDLDVPVILMTGAPTVHTAVAAVELGAFSYLEKPFEIRVLFAAIERAAALHRLARVKREALELLGDDERLLGDRVSLEERFAVALQSAHLVFQPVVSMSANSVVAYEALLRTDEPTLKNPLAFIGASERLKRCHELGRRVREQAAASAAALPAATDLFVNVHPSDLLDDELIRADAPLTALASRVVLEVTERAALGEMAELPDRLAAARALGYRLAVDDFGAGFAGLASLAVLAPDIVKVDMSLVRGIHKDERRRHLVASVIDLSRALSMRVVAEGIETADERDAVKALGGDWMQGYLFARPEPSFASAVAGM